MNQSVWNELQIHYHDDHKDHLILGLIAPMCRWLESQVEQVFFVRHWRQGPHIRLRIQSDAALFQNLKPALEARVAAYLEQHPSTQVIDQERLLRIHERLARDEMEDGELSPFYPNNSWHFATYDRRPHVIPQGIAALIEGFYAETNSLVFEMLEHVKDTQARITLALDLMIATLQATSPHIVSRFISYRSHAEVFIINTPNDVQTREGFERQYQAQSEVLRNRLDRILDGIATKQETVPFLQAWVGLINRYDAKIRQGLRTKELFFDPYRADTQRSSAYLEGEARLRKSPFHAMQLDDKANLEARSQDLGFNTFRMLVNLQYLHLNRIGLRPIERSMLAHLIANTVEARFEVSAYDLAKRYTYTARAVHVGGAV